MCRSRSTGTPKSKPPVRRTKEGGVTKSTSTRAKGATSRGATKSALASAAFVKDEDDDDETKEKYADELAQSSLGVGPDLGGITADEVYGDGEEFIGYGDDGEMVKFESMF